jgi:hypothetical protein
MIPAKLWGGDGLGCRDDRGAVDGYRRWRDADHYTELTAAWKQRPTTAQGA